VGAVQVRAFVWERIAVLLNRYLSIEVFFMHIGHGVLFWVVIAILAIELPWWASLLLLPIALFSIAGWAYETRFVLPVAIRLWNGDSTTPARLGPRRENTYEEKDA
jgi:hypothetical protein